VESKDINKAIDKLDSEIKEINDYKDILQSLQSYEGVDKVISSKEAKEILEADKKSNSPRIMTSIPSLDKMTEGFREGQLIVISAPTGNGKTTLCQTFTHRFWEKEIPCLWFSYEVGLEEFLEKFGETMPHFFLPAQLKQNSLVWLETRILESMAKYNCKVVFIDHLHYLLDMQKMAEAKSISLLVGMMMRELKKMAVNHNITIFLVSHMRKLMYDKLPELDDLRDSSFIAQESDLVLFLKRKKDGDIYTNNATLRVSKNRRNGKLGDIKLSLTNGQFQELTDHYEQN